MSLPPLPSVLALAIAFALPAVGLYRSRSASRDFDWEYLRRGLGFNWVIFLGLVAVVGVGGGPADLGLRVPSVGVLVDGLLFGFVAFGGTMVIVGILSRRVGGVALDRASLAVLDQPLSRRLAAAITGATVETTLFYGFVVEASIDLGADAWIAGCVAAIGVVLTRARGGARAALLWLPGALVLGGTVVLTRTVLVVVGIRLVYDVATLASGGADEYRRPTDAA